MIINNRYNYIVRLNMSSIKWQGSLQRAMGYGRMFLRIKMGC